MATLAQLRYDILNKLRQGISSDDDRISTRQIDFNIKSKRAALIRQEQQAGNKLSSDFIQVIPCLDVQLVDKSECCEIETDCLILRTTQRIPKTVSDLLTFVGTIDQSETFQIISSQRARWAKYSPFTSRIPKAYSLDDYIYITVEKTIEKIRIHGIFEDPESLALVDACNGPCYDSNTSDFPIPAHLTDVLLASVLQDLTIMLKTQNDITNDTQHNAQA
jgi:hypothetical protein